MQQDFREEGSGNLSYTEVPREGDASAAELQRKDRAEIIDERKDIPSGPCIIISETSE